MDFSNRITVLCLKMTFVSEIFTFQTQGPVSDVVITQFSSENMPLINIKHMWCLLRRLLLFLFVPGLFSWHPVCMSFAVSSQFLSVSVCHSLHTVALPVFTGITWQCSGVLLVSVSGCAGLHCDFSVCFLCMLCGHWMIWINHVVADTIITHWKNIFHEYNDGETGEMNSPQLQKRCTIHYRIK